MPELTELKAKAKQHEWLEEANEIIEDPMADSFDHIKEVIETGMELPPSPKVEKILGELSGKDKSPKVPFHRITSSYSYFEEFEFLSQFSK